MARTQGRVKSFNGAKGFGFIDIGSGTDVFVHIKDCIDDKQPVPGDVLTFTMEPSQSKPGQMVAKSVEGSTGVKEMPQYPVEPAPEIPGTGAHVGKVRTWNDTKGYGFIDLPGQPNVWLHVKECVNTQPQQGDWVRFDVQPSETKPGQQVAKNVTGGSQPLGQRGYGPAPTGGVGAVSTAAYNPYGVAGLSAGALQGVAGYAVQVQQPTLAALPGGGYVVQQSVPVQQDGAAAGMAPGMVMADPNAQAMAMQGALPGAPPALPALPDAMGMPAPGVPEAAEAAQAAAEFGQAPPVPPPPAPADPAVQEGQVGMAQEPAAQIPMPEPPVPAPPAPETALPEAPQVATQPAPTDANVAAQLAAMVHGSQPAPADVATPQ
ncbi:unnamed protein product [Symbiodinium pilosum]|uniref:CSD domain-containing protein n=1 Tax=Symbiodinium pilosum TaxID=2952 RepID=A0A812LXU1_SYMPI|nr:unnamed protein product [Symbiodinium pilosum]